MEDFWNKHWKSFIRYNILYLNQPNATECGEKLYNKPINIFQYKRSFGIF
jgi:hypothetical protein